MQEQKRAPARGAQTPLAPHPSFRTQQEARKSAETMFSSVARVRISVKQRAQDDLHNSAIRVGAPLQIVDDFPAPTPRLSLKVHQQDSTVVGIQLCRQALALHHLLQKRAVSFVSSGARCEGTNLDGGLDLGDVRRGVVSCEYGSAKIASNEARWHTFADDDAKHRKALPARRLRKSK